MNEEVDPRVQEQIIETKLRKEEEERRKQEEKDKIERRKEQLKVKIQKELEQRNLAQGVRGFEKDVEVKVLFDDGEINEKLIEDDDIAHMVPLADEENRDFESVKLTLKKYAPFLRRIFGKYSSSRVNKKDYFDEDSDQMAQVDLLRLCKEKNIEKNKQNVIELLKLVNDKNIKSLNYEGFIKFLERLTAHIYLRERASTHQPMGHQMAQLFKKMSMGENFKLQEDEDETVRSLAEQVRYNPHIQLPEVSLCLFSTTKRYMRGCMNLSESVLFPPRKQSAIVVSQPAMKLSTKYFTTSSSNCLQRQIPYPGRGGQILRRGKGDQEARHTPTQASQA